MTGQNSPESAWTYDHFLGFLLLYASHADLDYSENERNHILTQVNKMILSEVEMRFEQMTDYAQLDLILKLKEKFIHNTADKEKVLKILHDHFFSDGEFSRLENALYTFLNKLL